MILGNWQRVWLDEDGNNSGRYASQGASPTRFIHSGREYHLIIRHVSGQVTNTNVASVPSTNRLSMFPGGGRFRAFADIDALGHLTVVTEENSIVDGEVDSVVLALLSGDLTLTVGRTVGADLSATVAIPEGVTARWRNAHRRPDC